MDIEKFLFDSGFSESLKKREKIFSESAKQVMSLFGTITTDSLLDYATKNFDIQKHDVFKNPELFSKVMEKMVGQSATSVLLKEISNSISEIFHSKFYNMPINQILNEIAEIEVVEFLQKITQGEHILIIFKKEDSKKKIINKLISSPNFLASPKIIYSKEPDPNEKDVTHLHHVVFPTNSIIQNFFKPIDKIHVANHVASPTLIVCKDVEWWYENNYFEEHVIVEEKFESILANNMIRVCIIDESKINENELLALIKYHSCVIFDDPYRLYFKT